MLGTGARYAEYGITGGFFLFTQALMLGLAYPDVLVSGSQSFVGLLTASVGQIPGDARPAIQSLLVALALLSVFIVGLVLEIIGSVFMFLEAIEFRKRLEINQWVAKFVEAELPDYAEDYRLFLDLAAPSTATKNPPDRKAETFSTVHQRFRRLESALLAKVLTSGAKTEMLAEQISISRMSRSIGTALYVVSFEFGQGLLWASGWFSLGSQDHRILWTIILWIIAALILICGYLITLGGYSRFVNLLLSLVYASWNRQTALLGESRGERGET